MVEEEEVVIGVAAGVDHRTEHHAIHAAGLDLTHARVIRAMKTEIYIVHTLAVLCHLEDVTLETGKTPAHPVAWESLACPFAPPRNRSTTSSPSTVQ